MLSRDERIRIIRGAISMTMPTAIIIESELDRAGAFADQRTTYEQARDCIFGKSAQDGLDAMVEAGYVQPKREPTFTEDDVRELAQSISWFRVGGANAYDIARDVLAAGYLKADQ